ncbi:hypothetical protein DIJ69_34500 (plasmid) [Streptomyces globisporus]|nr:hypothetical protein DIJ69_34500 [Streptomyces globisporus]
MGSFRCVALAREPSACGALLLPFWSAVRVPVRLRERLRVRVPVRLRERLRVRVPVRLRERLAQRRGNGSRNAAGTARATPRERLAQRRGNGSRNGGRGCPAAVP